MSTNSLTAFTGTRLGSKHTILEFKWPLGREIPGAVRRLSVQDFCVALELVVNTMDTLKHSVVHNDVDMKGMEQLLTLYENLQKERDAMKELYDSEKASIVSRYESLINSFQRSIVEIKTSSKPLDQLRKELVLPIQENIKLLEKISEQYCMLESAINAITEANTEENSLPVEQHLTAVKPRGRPKKPL
jgi:hypothetical protein